MDRPHRIGVNADWIEYADHLEAELARLRTRNEALDCTIAVLASVDRANAMIDAAHTIAAQQTERARLRGEIELYMREAWHHEGCPQYGGNTYPACNCGYEQATEALQQGNSDGG